MNKNFLVIGDLFLDIYSAYESRRNSPEAKAPVLINKRIKYFLGGAGNVAANLRSLKEKVILLSFFQNDVTGKKLKKLLVKKKLYLNLLRKKILKILLKKEFYLTQRKSRELIVKKKF